MSSAPEHRLFFLLMVTLLWSAAMGIHAHGIASAEPEQMPANCYFSANSILDVELAPKSQCLVAVATLGAVDEQANTAADKIALNLRLFRMNTYMDFLFIVLYWSSFVLFARVQQSRWTKWVIGFISVCSLFDILENVRMLKSLTAVAGHSSMEGLLPRSFSLVKWTLLAIALGLTAILVWSRKGRLHRLLASVLIVSGVLTLVGLAKPNVMVVAVFGLGLSFLLILVCVFPYSADSVMLWLEYAYLLRFQILVGALLALALPLAYKFVPSLFVGVFDARGFSSFLFVVWAAFQLSWTIMVTSRLIFVYGPDRFGRATSIQPKSVGTGLVAAFGLLALPVLLTLFRGTADATVPFEWKILATILGLLLAIAVLALTASLHFAIEDPAGHSAEAIFPSFGFLSKATRPTSKFWAFIASYLARHVPPDLTPGILDTTGVIPRLRSGHEMAAVALAVFLSLYAALGVWFSPAWWNPDREPAALFFLLVLLTVLTWIFSGAAFFLDRTRLPVFSTLLAVSLLTGTLGTDHKFVVDEKHAAESSLSPSDVIKQWKTARSKGSHKVLVVATAGGGIRAAAWTAEVMTRLEEKGCEAVSDSLVLVSSVSGGSVGSMFVVGPYSKEKYPSTDEDLKSVRFNARRSSLSAVGWGLAYPDLARTVPVLGSFVPETFDRGWSLEKTWATGWKDSSQPTPTLKQWRQDVRNGLRPAVIFNGTASESGERFLIASTDAPFKGAKQFFELFPTKDIRVYTAARLSATFPYASPLARASAGSVKNAYHVGDGGYYDNSGLLSAVEWLDQARKDLQDYQVLLILIDAQPGSQKPGSTWSWQKQLVGPIETLVHVRSSSQQVRESIELEMAKEYLTRQDSHSQTASKSDEKSAASAKIDIISEPFLFWSPTDSDPPLSWHLTKSQEKEIGGAWASPANRKSWEDIRSKLGCGQDLDILNKAQETNNE